MHLSPWRALMAAGLFGCLMLAVGTVGLVPTSAADDDAQQSSSEAHEIEEPATRDSKDKDEEAADFPFKKKVRVVDPEGKPIAGATVEPWAMRAIGHGSWSKKGYGESEPPALTTNADGIAVIPFPRYAISAEKVPPRELTCRVVHPDFAETMYNDVPVTPDKRDEVTTITLHPGAIVDILMEGHRAEEMSAEDLYALTSSYSKNWFRKVLVDDKERLHLPRIPAEEDMIRLVYLPDDGPPVFSNVVSLSFIEGERVTLMFDMERSVSVEGELSDNVPRPVENGRVVAEVIAYDEGIGNISWRVWSKVNEDGTFRLDGLPRGDLQVIAICDGYMAESGEPPESMSDEDDSHSDAFDYPQVFKLDNEVTPITVKMTRTGGARFRVLHRGEPVKGAKVSLWPNVKWWGGGSQVYTEPLIGSIKMINDPEQARNAADTHELFSATTNEDGTAFVKNLPPGNQSYSVQHDTLEMPLSEEDSTYRYDGIKVTAGEVAEVTVRMQPQGSQPLEQRPLPSAEEEDPAPADDPNDAESQKSRPTDESGLTKTFQGHKSNAWAVAFSPNGKLLASGAGGTLGDPGEFKLWDIETGREIISIGKPRSVRWVDFAPGGATIVLAMHDNTAQVLNVPTCEVRHTLEGHSSGLDTAVFSPDGTLIATSSWDGTAKLWDARTGEELKTLDGHEAEVYFVAFSPDSRRVVTTSGDDTAKVWDVESGEELLTLSGHEDLVHCGVFSPDGERIATASWDKSVRIWDAKTGEPIKTLEGHSVQALAVAFSPDGRWIASVSGRWGDYNYDPGPGELMLWNAETFEKSASVAGHEDRIFAVAFSPDSKRIATASWDKTVKLWDVGELLAHGD